MWAVIDIGSNTIRLVIYTLEDGKPRSMLNKKYAAGLAGYIDQSNCISQQGINILLEVLSDISVILSHIKTECVLPFGTAALRNSANGLDAAALIKERCGLDVRILSGKEEAMFDYYGALENGIGESGLLVDVGGGSTELTFFKDKQVLSAVSIPVGSLNLYQKWVDRLLPTKKEAKRIKEDVRSFLQNLNLPQGELITQPIYSVGGTARAALKLMKECFNLEGEGFSRSQLKRFLANIEDGRREMLSSIIRSAPDRIHTIVPGLLIFQTVAKYFGSENFVTISYGVREGYLMHCLSERGNNCE